MKVKILYPTKNSVVSSIRRKTQDARRKTQDARRKTQDARRKTPLSNYNINSHLLQVFCKFHSIAGFFACIYDIIRCHYEGNARDIYPPLASNPICADCHASLCSARNDGKNIVITRFCKNRSNPQKRNFIILDCFASLRFARNDGKNKNRTRCAPHGDDDNKNFQFDKFQRLLSVIYKKNSLTKEISK